MEEVIIADTLLILSLLIMLAKVMEEIINHLGYPPVLGDILVGIIVGPTVLGILSEQCLEHLSILKWMGIISLLFLAGLETRFHMFKKYLKPSILVAVGGIGLSFALGYIGGLALGFSIAQSIFIGAIFTATSVSLTARALTEIGVMGTDVSTVVLGAAVIDDIGGLIVLGLSTAIAISTELEIIELALTAFIAIGFYIVTVFILHRVSGHLWRGVSSLAHLEDTGIALLLALTLFISWASVRVNLSLVVGAYAVGLAFSEVRGIEKIVHRFSIIPNIFALVFFIISVASIDLKPYILATSNLLAIIVLLLLAMIGKIVGCAITSYLSGFDIKKSLFIGVGMVPRAEVALIIASIGMTYNIIDSLILASTILLIYISNIVTPIILGRLWSIIVRGK